MQMRSRLARAVESITPIAAGFLYLLAFSWPSMGGLTASLSLLPVGLAGWRWGRRGAVIAGAVSWPLNAFLLARLGWPVDMAILGNLFAAIIFGSIGALIGHVREVNATVQRLMYVDQLTGFANRTAFTRELELATAASSKPAVIVALVGLVGFRELNESFGHAAGDELLRAVGRRLRESVDSATVVARTAGDTFGLMTTSPAISREGLAETALAIFRRPFDVGGGELQVEAHVGLARMQDHARDAVTLMRSAQGALDEAGRSPKGWAVASREQVNGQGRLESLADLRAGLANGELRLDYQPILDLTQGTVREFEALVRWERADGRLVPPAEFIPLAERSGLIVPLTEWVLDEAIRQCREWQAQGTNVRVAVNVGARSLTASGRLREAVESSLQRHGLDAAHLTIEITETDVMADPEHSVRILNGLKKLGVHIAVDDFGTGYSSLTYLNQLPLDTVKIDRSFMTRLLRDANTSAIVRAAIELSHALGLDVVAEGVEDRAVLERLSAMGCDHVQGYHLAKPMPGASVRPWLDGFVVAPVRATVRGTRSDPEPAATGKTGQTVLVVDDEHPLRLAAHRILTSAGLHVLHAATASEALRIVNEHNGQLDLVLSDIFLTDWRGDEMTDHLRQSYPDLKVLLMSGDPLASIKGGAAILAKPFSNRQLVDRVQEVLAA